MYIKIFEGYCFEKLTVYWLFNKIEQQETKD